MERRQIENPATSSVFHIKSAQGIDGRAEFNVPDIPNEPISNTYHNSGWLMHRREDQLMQETDTTRPPDKTVGAKPHIEHFSYYNKATNSTMYRNHV